MSDNTTKGSLPVFYTRDSEQYNGTKVALSAVEAAEGKKLPQYRGVIGKMDVQLWEGNGPRGPFFNVKTPDEKGTLVQVGNANAFVNARGFNALSISLRFETAEAAASAKEALELKEQVKPYTKGEVTTYFVNVYADVSRRAIEANVDEFKRLGFKTDMDPAVAARG